jgi:hypothetical protein
MRHTPAAKRWREVSHAQCILRDVCDALYALVFDYADHDSIYNVLTVSKSVARRMIQSIQRTRLQYKQAISVGGKGLNWKMLWRCLRMGPRYHPSGMMADEDIIKRVWMAIQANAQAALNTAHINSTDNSPGMQLLQADVLADMWRFLCDYTRHAVLNRHQMRYKRAIQMKARGFHLVRGAWQKTGSTYTYTRELPENKLRNTRRRWTQNSSWPHLLVCIIRYMLYTVGIQSELPDQFCPNRMIVHLLHGIYNNSGHPHPQPRTHTLYSNR